MAQERWQVSGSAAEQYERHNVPGMFAAWARDLVARAALEAGERVLDVACGTGIVARTAVSDVGERGQVTGIDLNAGMLAEAAKHVPEGYAIDWRAADATALPFENASFDVVLCQQGLQFFPDRPAAVAEMYRVLVPGGRVLASVWRSAQHNPGPASMAAGLTQHLSAAAGRAMGAPFAFGDAATIAGVFGAAGFREVATAPVELLLWGPPDASRVEGRLRALPIAEAVAAMPETARATMIDDILGGLPSRPDGHVILASQSTHVVSARR